jgi:hypothetical protein
MQHLNPIYKNKVWVIADGDKAGINVIERMKSKFSSWGKEYFKNITVNGFEFYYPQVFNEKVKALFEMKSEKNKFRKEKINLVNEVIEYFNKNKEVALNEFKDSAKDLIELLQEINLRSKKI